MRRSLGLVLGLCLSLLATLAGAGQSLGDFATFLGFRDPDGFVETVTSLRETGRLPRHYVRKDAARELGWQPGRDLCEVVPDRVIGGDRFGNREGLLPDRPGRRWFEADLDFDCGRRGAKRLVFSNDGLIFVTIDHYESFIEVPE